MQSRSESGFVRTFPDPEDEEAQIRPSDDATIDDLLSLHRAFRWLQSARSRIAENELTAKREHELIDEWERSATESDRRDAAFWEGQITAYALRRRQETNGRDKSLTGPHGRVETRELPELYERDDDALVPWAETHGFIRETVTRSVDWAALKKRLIPHVAGTVLLDGEMVPGVTHRERTPSVEVTTWD